MSDAYATPTALLFTTADHDVITAPLPRIARLGGRVEISNAEARDGYPETVWMATQLYRLRLFDCTSRGSASTWPLPAATSGRRYNALERNWRTERWFPNCSIPLQRQSA